MLTVVLVVDVANVMGSRPDGWWRDRPGAAGRLLASLDPLVGTTLAVEGEPAVRMARIVAVLEGRGRQAPVPDRVEVRLAPTDGDPEIVAVAAELLAADQAPLVVTADRGLRERLPPGCRKAGPRWLLDQL